MDTQDIIWIVVTVVVALIVIGLVGWLVNKQKHDRAEAERAERRDKAAALRQDADRKAQVLPDAELRAKEEQVRAEKLRREAERADERAQLAETDHLQQAARREDQLREADRLDPDAHTDTVPRDDLPHHDGPDDPDPRGGGSHRA